MYFIYFIAALWDTFPQSLAKLKTSFSCIPIHIHSVLWGHFMKNIFSQI